MNTYERNAFLYGYDELIGKPAHMQYLPTARSRRWRESGYVHSFSEHAYETALEQVRQGEIHAFRFVEAR